jgi:hypothetical protein
MKVDYPTAAKVKTSILTKLKHAAVSWASHWPYTEIDIFSLSDKVMLHEVRTQSMIRFFEY